MRKQSTLYRSDVPPLRSGPRQTSDLDSLLCARAAGAISSPERGPGRQPRAPQAGGSGVSPDSPLSSVRAAQRDRHARRPRLAASARRPLANLENVARARIAGAVRVRATVPALSRRGTSQVRARPRADAPMPHPTCPLPPQGARHTPAVAKKNCLQHATCRSRPPGQDAGAPRGTRAGPVGRFRIW